MGFARVIAWVLRLCDLQTTGGMQVVARDLWSLCWPCGVAFCVGFVVVAVFGCRYGSLVWGCGLVGLCDVALFC